MKQLFQIISFAKTAFAPCVFTFALASCGNLEKEIDLKIPPYESQLVVECYLEPGRPFTLLLTKSAAYFDPFPQTEFEFLEGIIADSAVVTIEHNGQVFELANQLFFDFASSKLYNYYNPAFVPMDLEDDFTLHITLPDGREITGSTRLLPVVPIDSVVVEFSTEVDSLARVLTYFRDDPTTENFYRRMLHENSLDSLPYVSFTVLDDVVEDNGRVVFGTNFDFAEGDTIINSLFHIDRAYYDFLESIAFASDANGNPFGQPAAINSNVEGDGIGIFTGIILDRRAVVIEK